MEITIDPREAKAKALRDQIRAERKKFKNMHAIPITALDLSEIPHNFSLTHCLPMEFELSPSKTEMVPFPPQLNSILADYDMAIAGSPPNKTLIRSRIDVVILTILAKMKREGQTNLRISVGSVSSIASDKSLESVQLQREHEIKFVWRSGRRRVRLSGIVDYSFWYDIPDNDASNIAMVEAETTPFLKAGMLRCLGHMAMIHETKKKDLNPDDSVYGVATDSFEWIFIRIRPGGEYTVKAYHWEHSSQEIVSLLTKVFAHAAGYDFVHVEPTGSCRS
ncbi:unnamed protein product [Penicillium glandicola]